MSRRVVLTSFDCTSLTFHSLLTGLHQKNQRTKEKNYLGNENNKRKGNWSFVIFSIFFCGFGMKMMMTTTSKALFSSTDMKWTQKHALPVWPDSFVVMFWVANLSSHLINWSCLMLTVFSSKTCVCCMFEGLNFIQNDGIYLFPRTMQKPEKRGNGKRLVMTWRWKWT